jgi:hypothetical protein
MHFRPRIESRQPPCSAQLSTTPERQEAVADSVGWRPYDQRPTRTPVAWCLVSPLSEPKGQAGPADEESTMSTITTKDGDT